MKEKRVVRTLSVRQVQSPRCSRATAGDVALENDLSSWDNPVIKYDRRNMAVQTTEQKTKYLASNCIAPCKRVGMAMILVLIGH
jgi:hypothetical protein